MTTVKGRFLLGTVLAISLASNAWAQQGIHWQPALESAKRVAGQTNRLVLIHFWAEWCKPCAQMDREVFARPDVAASIESNFVPVKVNVDHFPATVREYGVSIVPTDVVVTPDGQLVDKLIGLADSTQYVGRLNQIAQSRSPQAAEPASQMAALEPAAGAYQQPTTGPYGASPQQPAASSPASEDRYADYFGQRQQPEPAAASGAYANQWAPPTTAATPPSAGASQAPSYQIPTSPYQPGTTSVYQQESKTPYGAGEPSYRSGAASPYQNAAQADPQASNPPAKVGVPPTSYGMTSPQPGMGAAPYQNPAVATSPYDSGASPAYEQPSSPYGQGAGASPSPYEAANSPYQNERPAYRQEPAADIQPETPSYNANPWANAAPSQPAEEPSLADQLPAGSPPLALDGFCPVRLAEEERWVRGDVRWGARHEGRTYLFAGPEEQQRFLAEPQRYAPVLAGNDVVVALEQKQMVPGRREHGVWFHGKVYLFSDEASRLRFNEAPDQYINALEQSAGGLARRPFGSSSAGSAWQTYGPANGGRY